MTAAADILTEHVIGLISDSGLEALSVRSVASRASVSIGAVQHHFPTKAAMLRAALRTVAERSAARYSQAGFAEDARCRLMGLLELLIPSGVDDVSARVWVAFSARALTDPEIGEVYRDVWSRLHTAIAGLIMECDADMGGADRRATTVLALADGLTIDVLAGSITAEEGRSIMASAV
ncbi:TetR family transcriptional regulator C-terminal domain-containing protein [Saxibacter everestensis]|uniref:TetR family transcriptional regulator C-terminal domain-containing protein n=1 Tax=Saxibacter everestensis TaxID=2909229 RepID=A0ABY8QNT0_9MICO|nr:TetR family transcriptional regulator C-terminal domain-containing protein [Brevibacteriaceae bacterium ZFBP1038]